MAGKWQFDGSVTFDSGEVTIVPFDGAVALYSRGVVAATPFNGAGPSDRTGGVVAAVSFDGAVAFDSGEGCVLRGTWDNCFYPLS